jgi:Protein of unknown function (DUF2490)
LTSNAQDLLLKNQKGAGLFVGLPIPDDSERRLLSPSDGGMGRNAMTLTPFRAWIGFLLISSFPFHGTLAQGTSNQFWPEANLYYRFNDRYRVRFVASLTKDREAQGLTDGTFEGDLDVGLLPILRHRLYEDPDTQRGRFLFFRAGYAYLPSFSGTTEHRGIAEITARLPLPAKFQLGDRNRCEVRSLDGRISTRYRNQIKVERDLAIDKWNFTAFGYAEFFYDTRYPAWARTEYSGGIDIPIHKHWVFEVNYLRQNNTHPSRSSVNSFGLIVQWYLP